MIQNIALVSRERNFVGEEGREGSKGHHLLQSASPSSRDLQALGSQSKRSHIIGCGPLRRKFKSYVQLLRNAFKRTEMYARNDSFPPSHRLECEDSNWICNTHLGLGVRMPKIAVQHLM